MKTKKEDLELQILIKKFHYTMRLIFFTFILSASIATLVLAIIRIFK